MATNMDPDVQWWNQGQENPLGTIHVDVWVVLTLSVGCFHSRCMNIEVLIITVPDFLIHP